MSEEAITTPDAGAPAPSPFDDPGLGVLFGDDGAPAAPQATSETPAEGAPVAATPAVSQATAPVDPLAEELYAEDVLQTPEQAREAARLLREERKRLLDVRKKALNLHASAEKREQKLERTKQEVLAGKAQQAAWERTVSANLQDLESGDAERFITAVSRMAKSADPTSYWKKVSMKLASGGTFTEAEKQQAKADPETQAKLQQLESYVLREQEARQTAQIERLKTQHLQFAQQSDTHRFVKVYAQEQPENVRETIAAIMIQEHERTGRPIDVKTACDKLDASLRAQYELSQRAGGNTDGENGTAGSGPGAGREPSGQPPKPEAATRAPTTVPASLAATQGNAQRALTHREQRTQQVQSLPPAFWHQFGLPD
jgi:hypothetical protein